MHGGKMRVAARTPYTGWEREIMAHCNDSQCVHAIPLDMEFQVAPALPCSVDMCRAAVFMDRKGLALPGL